MLKYVMFDYENKESVEKFYEFYQRVLLDNYVFENLGCYQDFVGRLQTNDGYKAIVIYDDDMVGGAVFEYDKKSNVGMVHYLENENHDESLNQTLYDFAVYHIKGNAKLFYSQKPMIINSYLEHKRKNSVSKDSRVNEQFVKKIVFSSLKNNN